MTEESTREYSQKRSGQELRDIMKVLLNFVGDGAILLISLLELLILYNTAYLVKKINIIIIQLILPL